MNRQILVRGAAIAFAGVAASVFAAQQFMGTPAAPQAGFTPADANQVKSASLVGASAPQIAPEADADLPSEANWALNSPAQAPDSLALTAQLPEESAAAPQVAGLDLNLVSESSTNAANDFQPPLVLAQSARQANDRSCDATLTASAAIDALIDVRLSAPCAPNARIVVTHGDLAFSAFTDAAGEYASYLPGLSQSAMVEVFLPDNTVLQSQTVVSEATDHLRVIVQWTGGEVVRLHAYHRDAGYGQSGHVHAGRPFDPEMDAAYVLSLGEARGPEPMLAQVYSIPADKFDIAQLELEMVVGEATCGKDMSAFITQKGPGLEGAMEELTVAMPACGTGGLAILPIGLQRPLIAQLPIPPAGNATN
jgi:hypothetical protein